MKDNFSKQSGIYAKYRPRYPKELFDFILKFTDNREAAWDCGTGNGQSAKWIAGFFEKVFATDISHAQIEKADPATNIIYSVQPAAHTDFADNTFDLVTISQALHWFATDDFYTEVRRVSKPGAVIAAWAYSLLYINPPIDQLIRRFYTNVVGPHWDGERKYVDEEYRTIPFPFKEISAPPFEMNYYWTIDELEGYINTWSATQKFIASNNFNSVPQLIEDINLHWKGEKMMVRFPLHMKLGIVEK